MKFFKHLWIVGILLFGSLSGSAKKNVDLEGVWKLPVDLVEAFIDDASKELTLEFKADLGDANVLITDLSGKIICDKQIGSDGVFVLLLPLLEKSEYVLYVSFGNIYLQGSFDTR